jgi:Eukaryotic cytochrome b561
MSFQMWTQRKLAEAEIEGGADSGGDAAGETEPYQSYWKAHGYLMAISFGVLVPIAVGSSLLRHFLKLTNNGLWFQIHRLIMVLAALCVVCGFAVAIVALDKTDGSEAEHFKGDHQSYGLAIFVLVLVQVLMGIFRPHLPSAQHGSVSDDRSTEQGAVAQVTPVDGDPEPISTNKPSSSIDEPALKKSPQRVAFEIGHRLLAVALIALAWYNIDLGISLYEENFDIQDSYSTKAFWIVAGGLSGIIAIVYLYQSAILVPKLSKPQG